LLEPQRSNLVPHSEYVNAMTLQNISATANVTASPEGVVNAFEVEPTGTGFKTIGNFISVNAGAKYTISFFYKNNDHKNIGFYDNNTSGSEISINVQENTFTLGGSCDAGDVEDYGNGWYRAWCTFSATSSTLANYLIFRSDSNSGSYTATGSSIYVYGFQIEAGSYATSYIPTYGSSVTRVAEYGITNSIPSLFGSTEGSFYIELNSNYMEGIPLFLESSDSAGFNYATYLQLGLTSVTLAVYSGGASQVSISSSGHSSGDTLKVACAYKNNDFVMYVNGQLAGTDTSGIISTNLNKYAIGRYPAAGTLFQYNGNVNEALLFPTRLSNAELAALTTI
jgi:hypothetical protein